MRDDLHVGAPLPARWKAVIRALVRDHDWQQQAAPKAEAALTRDLLLLTRRSFAGDLRQILQSEAYPSVFGNSSHASLLDQKLGEFKESHSCNPFESKCIEYLRRHHLQINLLNVDQFLRSALSEATTEHMDSMNEATLAHIAQKASGQVSESRRRLRQIASMIDLESMSQEAVNGTLQPPKRVPKRPIDMDNEELREET